MQRSNPLLLYLSVHSALQTALSKRKLLSRTELVSAEGFNRGNQRAKLQLARKIMQWNRKRDCASQHNTLYVCYGWRLIHGTLRWEQLCALKGNSPTLPPSYTLVVRSRCLTNSQKVI